MSGISDGNQIHSTRSAGSERETKGSTAMPEVVPQESNVESVGNSGLFKTTRSHAMSELILGLVLGFVAALLFFVYACGDAISFYSEYKDCGKDFECFKKVIELQNEAKK